MSRNTLEKIHLMKKIGVFYDLDRTLLKGYSGWGFIKEAMRKNELQLHSMAKMMLYRVAYKLNKFDYESSVVSNVELLLTDRSVALCEEIGIKGFERYSKARLFPDMLKRIEWHRQQGHIQIMVTSAFDAVCIPIYKYLNLDDLCCTYIERENGVFTGKARFPLCHDEGKVHYINEISKKHDIDLKESYAYADNISDYGMLSIVGKPTATNPDRLLLKKAKKQNWPVLRLKHQP